MEAEQFKQFMLVLQAQQQQFLERVLTLQPPSTPAHQLSASPASVNMALLQPFENFDPKKESFKYYRQRFENFLEMKKITSNRQLCAQMFLNSVGAPNYNMLAALVSPRTPAELTYDELINTFEVHLCPKKNVLVSQHHFLSTYQAETQTIADYIATLRRDIIDCEFISPCECHVSIADIFLRAQFVRGIRDNSIREQILQSEVLVFDEIAKKAIGLEASKTDSRELSKKSATSTSANEEVNKVFKCRNTRRDDGNAQNRNHSTSRPRAKSKQRSRSQPRINFEKLGIKNLCIRCGRDNHTTKECNTDRNSLKCSACKKCGHVKKVCIRTLMDEKSKASTAKPDFTHHVYDQEALEYYGVAQIIDLFQNQEATTQDRGKYFVAVNIEGRKQKFEVDSGAGFTFIPRDKFHKLNISAQLQNSTVAFRSYTGNVFVPDGKVNVKVEYQGKTSREELYVVAEEYEALLGRTWIRHLGISLQEIDSEELVNSRALGVHNVDSIDDIISRYPEIFEETVGCIPGVKVSLRLRDKAKPIFHKERDVPYALRDKVNKELDMLESQGIISKVATSDWGSPLVVIPKPDGNVRLCVDYKIGVNERLVNANYPIRRIDDILNSLRNSRYFCRLDLYKAYLHVLVDEESSQIQTIATHRGTYHMNRLSFGIKTAPSEFNRIIDQILQGLPKTLSYFDDLIIHGATKEECQKNLEMCLQRLKKYDLHLNRGKCSFFQERVEYLGHVIEANKILKSPEKTRAITDMPRPSDVEGLRRFLGMVTYYSRFLPNNSSTTYPLRQLLRKNARFRWTAACEAAFIKLKREIASERILTPYDPTLPVVLTCDASPVGVAGILSHIIEEKERPIAFASRSLTTAEQNYSQLDREALAIVFSVDHFFNYVFGRHFKLVTDNRPLTRIFYQNAKLPPMTSGRLLRYATFLSAFNYEIVFKKGIDNVEADCLSRAPVVQKEPSSDLAINNEVNCVCMASVKEISTESLDADAIRKATDSDEQLSKTKREIQDNPELSYEYTLEAGILFKGQRVIIPKILQKAVLDELHRTHIGITKMKQLARRYVYWKGIDKDIEQLSKTCQPCAAVKTNPVKVPVHPWDEPKGNWDRIHIDYAGPFQDHFFLIVVDAKSRWAEIKICRNPPTSATTIGILSDIFATHGYPHVMVSDNATTFVSDQFKSYCKRNGIFQKFIAPGHPATNGLAERNVQTLKTRLKTMTNEPLPMHAKVREILFRYRATPLSNNKTPAEMYLQRNIRIQLDAIRPMKHIQNTDHAVNSRQLSVGERVQTRCYIKNQAVWKLGTIIQKFGKLHYQIKLDDGYICKRHINQLRKTEIPKKSVSFAPSTRPRDDEDSTRQQVAAQFPWIGLPNVDTSLQQPDGRDNQDVPEQPICQDAQKAPAQPEEDVQLRRSTRLRRSPSYLHDFVTGRS
jgi:hypothetical protein